MQDVQAVETAAEQTQKVVLIIITEAALEKVLKREIDDCGASGYTIMDVRGRGSQGKRNSGWDHDSNIRIEVICSPRIADAIIDRLQTTYYDNYAMVTYRHEVAVLRGEKFA